MLGGGYSSAFCSHVCGSQKNVAFRVTGFGLPLVAGISSPLWGKKGLNSVVSKLFLFQLWFWIYFSACFAQFSVVMLATFSDTAKKARPHESVLNSSQNEGRSPRETSQKLSKIDGKGVAGICAQLEWILG